jgi:protein phosphatase
VIGPDVVVPRDALVLLMGAAGAGKSTYASGHFPAATILSSDAYRERLSGDAADQTATGEAFRLLHAHAGERLAAGLLTVIDATNVLAASRAALMALAAVHGRPAIAIVLDEPLAVCLERNALRAGRTAVPQWIVQRQHAALRRALPQLSAEGFRAVHVVRPEGCR